MFSRRDRRELAALGLVVLAWGLLVAPLAHATSHAQKHQHVHGASRSVRNQSSDQPSDQHGAGTVEHLLALATQAPPVPELQRVLTIRELAPFAQPASPSIEPWNQVEESQGP